MTPTDTAPTDRDADADPTDVDADVTDVDADVTDVAADATDADANATDADVTDANANATDADARRAVEVDGVEMAFGEESVLDGVDATVEPGELVGLVGPNGAGKTTLLRAISGAITPESGTVRVASDDPERALEDVQTLSSAASSRRIAVVPQTTTLSFSFTVRQLVEMGRHPHRSRFQPPSPEDRELVDEAMAHTRTARFAERSIEDVSGGERQRILLARAIAQDAPVLLLDEPTANLDLHHAVETMSLVRELVDQDTAALAAIHDLELAARFCDRILVLAGGEIVASGAPESVLQRDVLGDAFDARIAVEPSPVDGGVTVRAMGDPEIDCRVHVVGGGEPAAVAIGRLGEAGADCSLGPVPAGDRSVSAVEAFGGEAVTVPPFATADSASLERATGLADAADAVVLAAGSRGEIPAAWRRCARETATPVVTVGEGDGPVESALRSDLDSLPGAVEAIAAREANSSGTQDRAAADAPLADGGIDGDTDER